MELITRSPFLDTRFEAAGDLFGMDREAYRNHVYRVLNFAVALAPDTAEARRKLEVASYFHDLGIWRDGTVDYLEPSARHARAYLEENGLAGWGDEVARMISEHHKVTSARGGGSLVEAFRQADWTDVTLGLRRFALPRSFVAEVRAAFPNAGFHRRLVELTVARVRTHPLNPLPMFKW